RGDRGALAPRRTEGTITRSVLRRRHVVGDEDDPAPHALVARRLQGGNAVEAEYLGLDTARTGGTAVAERCHRHALRKGRDDLGPFLAAHPHIHLERLDMDVAEAQRV